MHRHCWVFALVCALAGLSSPVLGADSEILFEPSSQIPAEGGPGVKLAFFPAGPALLSGGVGALSIGDGMSLGLGGYSLGSNYVPLHQGVKFDLGYSYYGITLDYALFTRRLCNLSLSIMAGPAQGWSVPRLTGAQRVYVNFAQIEPGINFILNVTHELRLELGVSYRLCSGADLDNELGTELEGSALSFTMMYGKI
jgi:hypothetical protein